MDLRILPYEPPILSAEGKAMGVGRGAGLHLGAVIKYMREGLGETLDGGNDNFLRMGFMFEMWVGKALAEYLGYSDPTLIVPGELERDKILMTPDRFSKKRKCVIEYKSTYKSTRGVIDSDGEIVFEEWDKKFYYYRWQVMAYCLALGVRNADVIVWHVNGDYSYKAPRGGPQLVVYQFRFTQEELLDHWKMVLSNAKALRRTGRGN